MSIEDDKTTGLERRARALLEESVARTDAHIRSRLSRARYAAVEEAGRSRPSLWHWLAGSSRALVPAGALAAVLLVAVLLWSGGAEQDLPGSASATAYEDVELLADAEALELIEDWEAGFYEWAAAEAEAAGASG